MCILNLYRPLYHRMKDGFRPLVRVHGQVLKEYMVVPSVSSRGKHMTRVHWSCHHSRPKNMPEPIVLLHPGKNYGLKPLTAKQRELTLQWNIFICWFTTVAQKRELAVRGTVELLLAKMDYRGLRALCILSRGLRERHSTRSTRHFKPLPAAFTDADWHEIL